MASRRQRYIQSRDKSCALPALLVGGAITGARYAAPYLARGAVKAAPYIARGAKSIMPFVKHHVVPHLAVHGIIHGGAAVAKPVGKAAKKRLKRMFKRDNEGKFADLQTPTAMAANPVAEQTVKMAIAVGAQMLPIIAKAAERIGVKILKVANKHSLGELAKATLVIEGSRRAIMLLRETINLVSHVTGGDAKKAASFALALNLKDMMKDDGGWSKYSPEERKKFGRNIRATGLLVGAVDRLIGDTTQRRANHAKTMADAHKKAEEQYHQKAENAGKSRFFKSFQAYHKARADEHRAAREHYENEVHRLTKQKRDSSGRWAASMSDDDDVVEQAKSVARGVVALPGKVARGVGRVILNYTPPGIATKVLYGKVAPEAYRRAGALVSGHLRRAVRIGTAPGRNAIRVAKHLIGEQKRDPDGKFADLVTGKKVKGKALSRRQRYKMSKVN